VHPPGQPVARTLSPPDEGPRPKGRALVGFKEGPGWEDVMMEGWGGIPWGAEGVMGGEDGGRWVAGFFLKPGSPDGTHLRGVGDTPPPGTQKKGSKRPAKKGVRIHGLRPDPTPPPSASKEFWWGAVGCCGEGRAWMQTGV